MKILGVDNQPWIFSVNTLEVDSPGAQDVAQASRQLQYSYQLFITFQDEFAYLNFFAVASLLVVIVCVLLYETPLHPFRLTGKKMANFTS